MGSYAEGIQNVVLECLAGGGTVLKKWCDNSEQSFVHVQCCHAQFLTHIHGCVFRQVLQLR